MKNKKLVIAAIVMALVLGAMTWIWLGSRQEAEAGGKSVTVTVIHADAAQKEFSYETDLEYLGELVLAEKLAEGVVGTYGLEIRTVDGETASWDENRSYWALYIGEEYATTGADSIVLTDGGEYSLVYTIG